MLLLAPAVGKKKHRPRTPALRCSCSTPPPPTQPPLLTRHDPLVMGVPIIEATNAVVMFIETPFPVFLSPFARVVQCECDVDLRGFFPDAQQYSHAFLVEVLIDAYLMPVPCSAGQSGSAGGASRKLFF